MYTREVYTEADRIRLALVTERIPVYTREVYTEADRIIMVGTGH